MAYTKERSLPFHNDKGYIFPFVLFVALVMFSAVTASILIYRNEIMISNQILEQMTAETIVQMSVHRFKEEKPFIILPTGTISYQFPSGSVEVFYEPIEPNYYNLILTIETNKKKTFSIQKRLHINERDE